jgi:hypothetical protein
MQLSWPLLSLCFGWLLLHSLLAVFVGDSVRVCS